MVWLPTVASGGLPPQPAASSSGRISASRGVRDMRIGSPEWTRAATLVHGAGGGNRARLLVRGVPGRERHRLQQLAGAVEQQQSLAPEPEPELAAGEEFDLEAEHADHGADLGG